MTLTGQSSLTPAWLECLQFHRWSWPRTGKRTAPMPFPRRWEYPGQAGGCCVPKEQEYLGQAGGCCTQGAGIPGTSRGMLYQGAGIPGAGGSCLFCPLLPALEALSRCDITIQLCSQVLLWDVGIRAASRGLLTFPGANKCILCPHGSAVGKGWIQSMQGGTGSDASPAPLSPTAWPLCSLIAGGESELLTRTSTGNESMSSLRGFRGCWSLRGEEPFPKGAVGRQQLLLLWFSAHAWPSPAANGAPAAGGAGAAPARP